MILWIVIAIFLIGVICCHWGELGSMGRTSHGSCKKLGSAVGIISGFILMLMLVCLVFTHTDFLSLVAERNAVQITLDEYRKSIDISVLEKVGAIQQAFVINKQIGVARFWSSTIWFGAFWPKSVKDLDYIK